MPDTLRRVLPRFDVRKASYAMLLSVALTLSAPDHWLAPLEFGSDHEHGAGAASTVTHGRHCHGKAATCTDLPLTAANGVAALDQWLAAPVVFVRGDHHAGPAALEAQASVEALIPPPRA